MLALKETVREGKKINKQGHMRGSCHVYLRWKCRHIYTDPCLKKIKKSLCSDLVWFPWFQSFHSLFYSSVFCFCCNPSHNFSHQIRCQERSGTDNRTLLPPTSLQVFRARRRANDSAPNYWLFCFHFSAQRRGSIQ